MRSESRQPEPSAAAQPPARDVVRWRHGQLRRAGFDEQLARSVAAEPPGVDIHALIELVERGCPPELAVRILAPLGPPR